MTTIGEIIQDNPMFDEGVFADRSFYHEHLEGIPLAKEIKKEILEKGEWLGISVQLLKNITFIALMVIPSLRCLTSKDILMVATVTGLWKINEVKSDPVVSSLDKDGFFQEGRLHGRLAACLDSSSLKEWVQREVIANLAFKVFFFSQIFYFPTFTVSKIFSYFVAGHLCTQVLNYMERGLSNWLWRYVQSQQEDQFMHLSSNM